MSRGQLGTVRGTLGFFARAVLVHLHRTAVPATRAELTEVQLALGAPRERTAAMKVADNLVAVGRAERVDVKGQTCFVLTQRGRCEAQALLDHQIQPRPAVESPSRAAGRAPSAPPPDAPPSDGSSARYRTVSYGAGTVRVPNGPRWIFDADAPDDAATGKDGLQVAPTASTTTPTEGAPRCAVERSPSA